MQGGLMNIGSKLLATGLLVGVVGCGCLEAHVSGKALARRGGNGLRLRVLAVGSVPSRRFLALAAVARGGAKGRGTRPCRAPSTRF